MNRTEARRLHYLAREALNRLDLRLFSIDHADNLELDRAAEARKLGPALNGAIDALQALASRGPFSARLVRRRPLVAALADDSDARVRQWARRAAQALEDRIAYWDAIDRGEDRRFE